jgi:hypothetical protein
MMMPFVFGQHELFEYAKVRKLGVSAYYEVDSRALS